MLAVTGGGWPLQRWRKVFAAYPLAYGLTSGASAPPDLIQEAKESLIMEGHVKPPFDFSGITFRVLDA
ncbi:MAG TPA: hypothetical protein VIJ79_00245 [Acidobacteriaceae bacterium]